MKGTQMPTVTTDCPCQPGSMNIHLAGFPTKEPNVVLMITVTPDEQARRSYNVVIGADGTADFLHDDATLPGDYDIQAFQVRGRKTNYQFVASVTATVV